MAAHRIGYARVSTRDQNFDLRLDALKSAGCDRVYEDTISGTKTLRPGLAQALDVLREVASSLGVSGPTLYRWVPATDAAKASAT